MAKKELVILGAGGHGRVVADVAEMLDYDKIVFIDAEWPRRTENLTWKIIGNNIDEIACETVFVAIGTNQTRLKHVRAFQNMGKILPILVHPSAQISRYASVGPGSVVMANVVVSAGAKLGSGVIANTACTIDHDCVVGDGVHLSPGVHVAGGVRLGECVWLGIGSSLKEDISVGPNALVGAGSVVIADVRAEKIVVGVPAHEIASLR